MKYSVIVAFLALGAVTLLFFGMKGSGFKLGQISFNLGSNSSSNGNPAGNADGENNGTSQSNNIVDNLPEGFKSMVNYSADGQEVITVQNKDGSRSFQIFKLIFDETGLLTPERIKKDLPDAKIQNPYYVDINSIKALSFYSYNADIGDTFEIWFIDKGHLYQVMTYKNSDAWLLEIVKTLKFQ